MEKGFKYFLLRSGLPYFLAIFITILWATRVEAGWKVIAIGLLCAGCTFTFSWSVWCATNLSYKFHKNECSEKLK